MPALSFLQAAAAVYNRGMGRHDYYRMLGVPPSAHQHDIRAAYRERAKRCHPDKAGPQAKREFQDLSEAYETLSDPGRRRAYDDELHQAGQRGVQITKHGCDPAFRPRSQCWDLEVLLSPEEAREGVVFPVRITSPRRCEFCSGGWQFIFPCPLCSQRGFIDEEQELLIELPPITAGMAVFDLALNRSLGLRLYVRVTDAP